MIEAYIVTKWLEPYVILETFKRDFDCTDLTFDGSTKLLKLKELMLQLEIAPQGAVGMYLKNVNKFYFMTPKDNVDVVEDILKTSLKLDSTADFSPEKDVMQPIQKVDMAKAEVGILIKK